MLRRAGETALVEAFNLKAAIEYNLGNIDAAREALSDMPPRDESELDAGELSARKEGTTAIVILPRAMHR